MQNHHEVEFGVDGKDRKPQRQTERLQSQATENQKEVAKPTTNNKNDKHFVCLQTTCSCRTCGKRMM